MLSYRTLSPLTSSKHQIESSDRIWSPHSPSIIVAPPAPLILTDIFFKPMSIANILLVTFLSTLTLQVISERVCSQVYRHCQMTDQFLNASHPSNTMQYHHTYTFMPPVYYLREHLLSFFEHVMNDDSSENYCCFRHCRSYNYGILWKKMCYSPGIVNQGRRFICPVHCGHSRHR